MNKVALHEVATINPRASQLSLLPTDPVSFVPMAAVSELSRSIELAEVRQYSEVSKGYTYFEEGDVIVAKITPCYENGKIALASDLPHRVAFGSTEFHVFRAGEAVDNKYIFHLLQVPVVRTAGASQMKGAAGQKRVPADYFKSLRIPLPPLAEQKRIAAILDAADAPRTKRRESLAQLDTLLQSTFLDMFGDPVTNPKGWRVVKSKDLFLLPPKIGTITPAAGNGHLVVRVGEVGQTRIAFEQCGRVELTEKDFAKFRLEPGDTVIARAIGSRNHLGKASYFDGYSEPVVVDSHVMRFRPDSSKCNGRWFYSLLASDRGKVLLQQAGGATAVQFNINAKQASSLDIALPPLDLQRRFATIVKSVEQQKARLREHLAELDTLFASLQQRAFNGDL